MPQLLAFSRSSLAGPLLVACMASLAGVGVGQHRQSAAHAQEDLAPPAERPGDAANEAPSDGPSTYMGRVIAPPMHYSGADWLMRNSRRREENPTRLLEFLNVQPGQIVCDFGCGNGYHTLPLARRVAPEGSVYAVDIQPEMLELLTSRTEGRGIDNVRTILASPSDPGLPAAIFDLVLMVDVYHELSDPPAVLAAVRTSMKRRGRLAVVEFREEDPAVPIHPLHKMSQEQVMREIPANGFKLVGQFDRLPWQHVLLFARDDSPQPAIELRPWAPAQ
ncbi:MAG TPA: methyltransferase domain-containing protein [Lacipirellulaceae bacterium]|nr:methyltransferase domain-containing protein [Lacipirellulaceae bacterium]HMP05740.1 methyltransferase domain-containing protein [Lacipirellulaceae bacterium]